MPFPLIPPKYIAANLTKKLRYICKTRMHHCDFGLDPANSRQNTVIWSPVFPTSNARQALVNCLQDWPVNIFLKPERWAKLLWTAENLDWNVHVGCEEVHLWRLQKKKKISQLGQHIAMSVKIPIFWDLHFEWCNSVATQNTGRYDRLTALVLLYTILSR